MCTGIGRGVAKAKVHSLKHEKSAQDALESEKNPFHNQKRCNFNLNLRDCVRKQRKIVLKHLLMRKNQYIIRRSIKGRNSAAEYEAEAAEYEAIVLKRDTGRWGE